MNIESKTPRTAEALRRTQGMFRAASAANGFTDHARQLETESDQWKAMAEELVESFSKSWVTNTPETRVTLAKFESMKKGNQ